MYENRIFEISPKIALFKCRLRRGIPTPAFTFALYFRSPLRLHNLLRVTTALVRLLQIRDSTRLQVRTDNTSSSRTEGKPLI